MRRDVGSLVVILILVALGLLLAGLACFAVLVGLERGFSAADLIAVP
jgi:hypothetical protein